MHLEDYRNYLREILSSARFYHSQCVEEEAVRLANIYNADIPKTRIAALLHDVCKEMDAEKQLNYLKNCGILLDSAVMDNSFVWHGITGACFVQKELNVTDKDIINAIKYHTTARANMTLLEEIVFLADYTSKDRNYENVDTVRAYIKQDKELAIAKCLEHGLTKCLKTGQELIGVSVQAFNFYLDKTKTKGVNY